MKDVYCECRLPMVAPDGYRARPTENCPRHKILAERWDDIHSWDDYTAAMDADRERMEREG